MSTWYQIVCRHTDTSQVTVCILEDDGGAMSAGHDQIAKWREEMGLPQPDRRTGIRLLVYNRTTTREWQHPEGAPGKDPARVDIAHKRNKRGHTWEFECAVCHIRMGASDDNLIRALGQVRLHMNIAPQDMILTRQFLGAGGQWQEESARQVWVVPFKELNDEVNNPGVLGTRAHGASS